MKRGGLWLIVGGLVLVLFYGVSSLYRLRISRGDLFPEYSSMRADPLGVRAMYDAAGLLPGREALRWLRPVGRLQAGAGDVVFVAGVDSGWGGGLDEDGWTALDRAAVAGAHVVVAWHADTARPEDGKEMREMRADPWLAPEVKPKDDKINDTPKKSADKKEEKGDDADSDKQETPARTVHASPPRYATEHERRWGFRLGRRELVKHTGDADALRGADAPADWPVALARWRSDLFFMPKAGEGWRELYQRGAEPVMMERARGAGSVTLLADSFVLSNEAVQRERATAVLASLFGDAKRVIFVESHLGVEIESGVAVLARRYGLGGAALTALVLAGLWIWRRATPLAPIIPEDAEVRLTLAPTAGLEALLRRAVPPAKLFTACLDAWKHTAAAGDQRRLEAAPTPAGVERDPVAAYNAATRTLSHKRLGQSQNTHAT
ncbi:MAG: hypothetical protein WC205_02420 [Opitutaceae bacterium]|jgi:hypothetical protein